MTLFNISFTMDVPAGYDKYLFWRDSVDDNKKYWALYGPLGPAEISNLVMTEVVVPPIV